MLSSQSTFTIVIVFKLYNKQPDQPLHAYVQDDQVSADSDKTNDIAFAPSKVSDQAGHMPYAQPDLSLFCLLEITIRR